MAWQYMRGGEIQGPMADEAFEALRRDLDPGTKVYKDGWKEWRKLEEVPGSEFPQPPPALPADESAAQPAGFMRRAGAFILDYLLIRWAVGFISGDGSGWQGWSSYGFSSWNYSWSQNSASDYFGLAFWATLLYEAAMVARFGWTLGKFVFGIRVSHEGLKLSYGRSAARVLAKKLNWLTLGIGYLMALWDKDHKALQDHLCKTRVFLR
jgi:uncharacterized RDD family membrane protein YckC